MSWQLIDSDGVSATYSHVDSDGSTRIVDITDDKPIQAHNANLRQMDVNPKSDMRPVASIDLSVAQNWILEAGIDPVAFWMWPTKEQTKFFRKKVMDGDNAALRTNPIAQSRLWVSETHYKAVDIPKKGLDLGN